MLRLRARAPDWRPPEHGAGEDANADDAATPIIEVESLSLSFRSGGELLPAVRGVSFALHRGETLALVGESGSGKSVTALSIMRLLNPAQVVYGAESRIRFDGEALMSAAPERMQAIRGDRIGMIFQEPMSSLNPLHTVEKQIGEILMVHKGLSASAARERTLELLERVGLDKVAERLHAWPHQLSGGQRQRVMIAMALANDPDVLIADEPTTALDVTVQKQILALLTELQQQMGLAILLISHDLNLVRRVADRVAVMRHGELVEMADSRLLFSDPQHPYTRELLAAEPSGSARVAATDAAVLLRAEALKVWFPIRRGVFRRTVGYVKAVDGVSLELKQGDSLGIVGESGSGKSTLALALLRLLPSTGLIEFDSRRIDSVQGSAMKALREDMQIVFQDPYGSLSPRLPIGEIVGEGLRVHRASLNASEREERVIAMLERVGLDADARHRYPHEFSGGQRQRIAIARALVLEPKLLVLDEPTSALDRAVQVQVIELLRELQHEFGLSYLFISHDLKVVRAIATHVLVMRDGVIVEQGEADAIFDSPQECYTQELVDASNTAPLGSGIERAGFDRPA